MKENELQENKIKLYKRKKICAIYEDGTITVTTDSLS